MITDTTRVLGDILDERSRQDEKWGAQSYPNGTKTDPAHTKKMADTAKEVTDFRAKTGTLTWNDIFREEYFELLDEEDYTALRKEIIQAAAVLVAWVEDLDRKNNPIEVAA